METKKQLVLNDLLNLSPEEIAYTKVRLNRNNGEKNPIDEFKKNPDGLLSWNYWNNKPYKKGQISIGLVDMGNHKWLLFTVGQITKVVDKEKGYEGVQVEYETLEKYSFLFGRVVIEYHNKSQQLFRDANSVINQLVVSQILPTVYTGFEFPGYDNVHLTFEQLETIIRGDYPAYRNALANQKAVYVQTDRATGKLYIGSATAKKGMLLSRWTSYVQNGHGGNEELIKLVSEKGFEYIKNNFTYSILEVFNSLTDDNFILKRESHWKEVFDTRNHGYNAN